MLPPRMDSKQLAASIDDVWIRSAVPTLERFIRIPNQSPIFDPNWKRNGYMQPAVKPARDWVEQQGFRAEVHEIEARRPLLFIEVESDPASTILMYRRPDQ